MIPEGCSVLGQRNWFSATEKVVLEEGINCARGCYHSEPTVCLGSPHSACKSKCLKHSTYSEITSFLIFKFFSLTPITDETKL